MSWYLHRFLVSFSPKLFRSFFTLPRGYGRSLNAVEKQRYHPFFSSQLLNQVRVVEEGVLQANGRLGKAPFWLSKHMQGVVLGNTIYFRQGAYHADTPCGMALLAHELTHVQQFANGMTICRYIWASRKGYRNNPYEVEAYENGAKFFGVDVCSKILEAVTV
jgi:hypothetical protein